MTPRAQHALCDASHGCLGNRGKGQHGFDNERMLGDIPVEGVQEGVLIVGSIGLGRTGDAGAVHPAGKGLGTLHQAPHHAPQHPLHLVQAWLDRDLWGAQRQRDL